MTDHAEGGASLEEALRKVASELAEAAAAVRQEMERTWGPRPDAVGDGGERPSPDG